MFLRRFNQILILLCLVMIPAALSAQDIAKAEFFFDTDPGVGNGLTIEFPDGDPITETPSIPTTGLSAGTHYLFFRVQDTDGKWSIAKRIAVNIIDDASPQLESPSEPLVAAEYFIDDDPGAGNGLDIPGFTMAGIFSYDFPLPIGILSEGEHYVYIRTLDAGGNWSIAKRDTFEVVEPMACIVPQVLFETDIVDALSSTTFTNLSTDIIIGATTWEWDVDDDGSIEGTGSAFSHTFATSGYHYVRLTANNGGNCQASYVGLITVGPIPDTGITADGPLAFCEGGNVTLTAAAGLTYVWSTGESSQSILITETGDYTVQLTNGYGITLFSEIIHVEAYENPSFVSITNDETNSNGNGSIAIIPNSGLDFYSYVWNTGATENTVGSLTAGNYNVDISNANCTINETFVINDIVESEGIQTGEYFVDTDPGIGNGTALVLSEGNFVDAYVNMPTTGLSIGQHWLYFRMKDLDGSWGITKRIKFTVHDTTPPVIPESSIITDAEYFIDTDPGIGNGIALVIPDGASYSENYGVDLTGIPVGDHRLYIRSKDLDGNWGIAKQEVFYVIDDSPPVLAEANPEIIYAEYFFDTDPGTGNGTELENLFDGNSVSLTDYLPVTGLSVGTHWAYIRVLDENDNWSITKRLSFEVEAVACTVPEPDFSSSETMAGSPTSFTNLTTGYDGGTTWEWDIFNDDVVDGTTFNYNYTFLTPGIYLVRLTATSTAECFASVVHQVTVLPAPDPIIAASGPLSFCDGSSVTLIAEAGNNYLWNTGETTQSINVITSGEYWCEITNTFGFTIDSEVVMVEVFPLPAYTIFANEANAGMSNGSASVIPDNPLDEYVYNWSDGQTTSTATNLLAGIYTVEITNGGCTVYDGVVVNDNPLSEGIVNAEWFVDTDPGVGNGTAFFFTQGETVNHIDYFDMTGVPAGTHRLYIRIQNDVDAWSISKRMEFNVIDDSGPDVLPEPADLVRGEYYFNTDPGIGNGVPFNFPATAAITDVLNAPTTGLEPGEHYIYMRLQDTDDNWGLVKRSMVHIIDPLPETPDAVAQIVAAEYFFDTDPGAGNGTSIEVLALEDVLNITSSVSVAGLDIGGHTLWVRVKDTDGNWSITKYKSFLIEAVDCISPQVDFTYAAADAGMPMSFTNLSTDVDAFTSYLWDVYNNGTSNAATTDLTYTFPTPGIYQVKLTAVNSFGTVSTCESFVILNVIVGPTPDNNIVADGPLEFCEGGSVTLSVAAGNTYLWSTGETTNSIVVTESGTYWVEASDAYMTLLSEFVNVTVYENPVIVATINDATNGDSNGSIITEVSGGSGTYSYTWDNGQTFANAVDLAQGTYTLDANDGFCSTTGVYGVNNLIETGELIAAEYFFDTDPGTGNANSLAIGVGDSYLQAANIDVSVLSVGWHYLYMRTLDVYNNWSIATRKKFHVYEETTPTTLPPTEDIVAAEYFVVTDPGVDLATVEPITPGPSVTSGITTLDVSTFLIGDYFVYARVKDADNQWSISKREGFTITEECADYTIAQQNVSCYNAGDGQAEILMLPGSEPYDFVWSNGDTGPITTGLIEESVTVTVTDVNGCVIMETFDITEPTEVFILVDATTSSCITPNGTATSIVSGGVGPYNYLWSTGETIDNATNLGVGTNWLQITDATGCVETITFDVDPNDGPLVSGFVNDVICNGGSTGSITLSITGGVNPYDILWDDGQTTIVAGGLEVGSHQVTVTDDAGCIQNYSYFINEPLAIETSIITQDVTYYEGNNGSATVSITGGVPTYDVLWDTGETNQTVNGLEVGFYVVDITDANGCAAVDTAFIQDAVICLSDSIDLEIDACLGETTGLFTDTGIFYEWSTGSNDATIYVSPVLTTEYTLYRLDVVGCPYYDTVTVNVINETVASGIVSGPINLLLNESGVYSVTGSIGTIQWQYSYDQIDWFDYVGAVTDTESMSFDQAGIVYVRVAVESGLCGTAYGTPYPVTIGDIIGNRFDIPIIIPTLDYTDTRDKTPYTDNYTGPSNQTASDIFYQYTIEQCTDSIVISLCGSSFDTYLHILDEFGNEIVSNNNSIECGNFNSQLSLTGTTQGEIYYFVVEGNGSETGVVQLNVYNVDPYVVNSEMNICSGETITLETNLGDSFLWSTGETTSSIEVMPMLDETFYVDITNANGCVYQSSSDVFVTQTMQITVSADTAICFGGIASLEVSGSEFYSWSTGQSTDNINISPFVPTMYYVTGTDLNTCPDTDSVFVDVNYTGPDQPLLISPADGVIDQVLPINFGWEDVSANDYDLYIWPSTDAMPALPFVNSIDNTEEINSGLADGEEYLWTVIANNACGVSTYDTGWLLTMESVPCLGDFNDDGQINTADLLILLAEFGCTSSCTADMDGDGFVNTTDLLAFLGVFGTSCP